MVCEGIGPVNSMTSRIDHAQITTADCHLDAAYGFLAREGIALDVRRNKAAEWRDKAVNCLNLVQNRNSSSFTDCLDRIQTLSQLLSPLE